MTNPKDTIPGMTWFSNANASASSVPTNLFAALSDPTDTHSLAELRAHLEDGGDMEPEPIMAATIAETIAAWERKNPANPGADITESQAFDAFHILRHLAYLLAASERSGGDGA